MADSRSQEQVVSSTVERLLLNAVKREEQQALSKEEFAEFKKVANSVLSTRNGKFFWKYIRKLSGITKPSNNFNPVYMAARQEMQNLDIIISGLLNPDVRNQLNEEE